MAKQSSVDLTEVFRGLDGLDAIKTRLARSMAVAGGSRVRDEAKARAPVGTEEGGSIHPGALRDAIYLAFSPEKSVDVQIVYRVSWNSKKAPHGHLLEFGHWQPYKVAKINGGYGGGWYTTNVLRDSPKWTPAVPFLRPALDATRDSMRTAMIQRGRERLPELISEIKRGSA